MESKRQETLALDLVGISSAYQGGATVFAHTLLAKFLSYPDIDIDVYVNEIDKKFYEANFPKEWLKYFHFVAPRSNFLIKVLSRVFTRYFPWDAGLEFVQKFRWSKVIENINLKSYACLTLSTYISFPLKGKTHICTLHDIQEKALPQFFARKEKRIRDVNVRNTLRNVTGLQTSSIFVMNEIKKHYKHECRDTVFEVISEGYNSDELNKNKIPEKKLTHGIRILFPANYWLHKDHKTFFIALAELNKKYNIEVFSTGSLMGNESEIRERLNELNLGNVHLLGYVSRGELIELYRTSHIVLSCSMYESSSMPLIEGAALNCIPVASDIEPHKEMCAYLSMDLFELGNPQSLEIALSRVIDQIYESDGAECARNENLVGNLEWGALVPKYVKFLEQSRTKGPIQ